MSPAPVSLIFQPAADADADRMFGSSRIEVERPAPLDPGLTENGNSPMNDLTRQEVQARIEASEARVAMVAESIKSDMSGLRSEISAQAKISQAAAETFYARANQVLSQIDLSNEKHKNALYGTGYKVIVWTVGTVITLGVLGMTAYRFFWMNAALQ